MAELTFAIGQTVLVGGQPVEVCMETATQLLVRAERGRDERWVPRASASSLGGAAAAGSAGQRRPSSSASASKQPSRPLTQVCADEPEDDECFVCGQAGKLTCCDVCPRVYHLKCLPPADAAQLRKAGAADEDWWCPRCRRLDRLTFAMSRELGHPTVGSPGTCDEVARRLFAFLSDAQHDGESWDSLREAGAALLHAMRCLRV